VQLAHYEVAQRLCDEGLQKAQSARDTISQGLFLRAQGLLYTKLNQFEEGLKTLSEAVSLLGRDTVFRYMTLLTIATVYHETAQYAIAESLYRAVADFYKLHFGDKSLQYSKVLHNLGVLYLYQEKYDMGMDVLGESADIFKEVVGEYSFYYGSTIMNLAIAFGGKGRLYESDSLYRISIEVFRRVLGERHPLYIAGLAGLATARMNQGRLGEAEQLYLQAIQLWEAASLPLTHSSYLTLWMNLAGIYEQKGQYTQAENIYLKVLDGRKKIFGDSHPLLASIYLNIAHNYANQGYLDEASKLCYMAEAILRQNEATATPDYGLVLLNLAQLNEQTGRLSVADSFASYAQAIFSMSLSPQHRYVRSAWLYRSELAHKLGRESEADSLYALAEEAYRQATGVTSLAYAAVLLHRTLMEIDRGRYAQAESLMHKIQSIYNTFQLIPTHDNYLQFRYLQAKMYARQGKFSLSDSAYMSLINQTFNRIASDFPALSAQQRIGLLNSLLGFILPVQLYCIRQSARNPVLVEIGYFLARSIKGLVLTSTEQLRHAVELSGDSVALGLLAEWRTLNDMYAYYLSTEAYEAADSIRRIAYRVEKKIAERVPAAQLQLPHPLKDQAMPTLRKGQAVVEVARVPYGDSVVYAFYLLTPQRKDVRLQLFTRWVDPDWEARMNTAYEIFRSPGAEVTGYTYKNLWAFIDSLLPKGTKEVFFAPDGVYYRVNVASLYDADSRAYVADKYAVRYVATSRRLLDTRPKPASRGPVVIGNPAFGSEPSSGEQRSVRSFRAFPYGIPALPGAEAEAQAVATLLGTQPVIGAAATEAYVKGITSPRVLHIATHGYFLGEGLHVATQAGLLFAQAQLWDSLAPALGEEDGRLTLQEVLSLNLLGTDLVVLSACETGLGAVHAEGLYGLQRAFLEAGAQAVISTLWQIDDMATKALMEKFYAYWLQEEQKSELIYQAFGKAVDDLRKKYASPYYWGAFILME
jgi:tetratricopeptide (TPR) repeat protein